MLVYIRSWIYPKDVRAGLSYQNILEKLEPKLYAMADKLNTATSNDQSKSSLLMFKVL